MTRRLTLITWATGIAILIALVIYHGATTITAAVAAAGWGLLVVTAFHLIPMIADTIAWRYLLDPESRPRFHKLLWMRWIGESACYLRPKLAVMSYVADLQHKMAYRFPRLQPALLLISLSAFLH
jgi:hypothetical protein